MTENEFMTADRITKIKSVYEDLGLEKNAYIAFSGGKDSTILHYLIDEAIPNNNIPRVFSNTGLEFGMTVDFVKRLAENDKRFIILTQTKDIRKTLDEFGYPFKSKEHARNVDQWNKGNRADWLIKYIGRNDGDTRRSFKSPVKLVPMFSNDVSFNVSNLCCKKLKKDLSHEWQKRNGRKIVITGIRRAEEGNRKNAQCLAENNTIFNPLVVVSDDWEKYYLHTRKIQLSPLYYPPFSFNRTGCIGCPFNKDIQKELQILKLYATHEYKRANLIWGRVYDWYRAFNYRLKREEVQGDLNLLLKKGSPEDVGGMKK